MLPIVSAVLLILFLPITLGVYVFYDGGIKRASFAFLLYDRLPVAGGYIKRRKANVYIHYGKKKAKTFKFSDAKNFKFKLKYLKGVEIIEVKDLLSAKFAPFGAFSAAGYIVSLKVLSSVFNAFSPVKIRSFAEVGKREDTALYLYVAVAFNLFLVSVVFIRYAIGGICRAIKKN